MSLEACPDRDPLSLPTENGAPTLAQHPSAPFPPSRKTRQPFQPTYRFRCSTAVHTQYRHNGESLLGLLCTPPLERLVRFKLRAFLHTSVELHCRLNATSPGVVPPLVERHPILTTPSSHRQATSLRSIKALVPLLDRVLVQRIKAETKTASGIFLPESSVKELNEAKVLAVGPGALDKDGKRVPMGVSEGDKVLIPQVRQHFTFPGLR